MNNYTHFVFLQDIYTYARNTIDNNRFRKYLRIAGFLLFLFTATGNKAFAFSTSYYPTTAAASSDTTYCVGATPIPLVGSLLMEKLLTLGEGQ